MRKRQSDVWAAGEGCGLCQRSACCGFCQQPARGARTVISGSSLHGVPQRFEGSHRVSRSGGRWRAHPRAFGAADIRSHAPGGLAPARLDPQPSGPALRRSRPTRLEPLLSGPALRWFRPRTFESDMHTYVRYHRRNFLRKFVHQSQTGRFPGSRSSPVRAFSDLSCCFRSTVPVQWHFTHGLPLHSDRIAQDSHLIPYYPYLSAGMRLSRIHSPLPYGTDLICIQFWFNKASFLILPRDRKNCNSEKALAVNTFCQTAVTTQTSGRRVHQLVALRCVTPARSFPPSAPSTPNPSRG